MSGLVPIGIEDGRLVRLRRASYNRHWLTAGPTGSGKTAAVLGRLLHDIATPGPVPAHHIVVDPKGELALELVRYLPIYVEAGRIDATDINLIAPWKDRLVPLNLLAADKEKLPRDIRASVVVARIERFVGEALGSRMKPLLHPVIVGVMGAGGSLRTVLDVLERDDVRHAVAASEREESVRRFLEEGVEREPPATRAAICARLRHMLELSPVRAMLGAASCVSGESLLGTRMTVVDLGGAPSGQDEVSYALSGWLVSLIIAALFDRDCTTPQIFLTVDEAQKVVRYAAEGLERVLQEIRWKGATLSLITQSIGQISDAAVRTALIANVGNIMALAPREEELKLLSRWLPEPSGRVVNADLPDRLLTEVEERREIARRFRNLPSRVALFVNTDAGRAVRLETPNIPFAELRRRASATSADVRRAVESGGIAMRAQDLEKRQAASPKTRAQQGTAPHPGSPPPAAPAASRRRRGRTVPKVELPDD